MAPLFVNNLKNSLAYRADFVLIKWIMRETLYKVAPFSSRIRRISSYLYEKHQANTNTHKKWGGGEERGG